MPKIDIEKELEENQVILVLVPSMDYNDLVVDTVKQLTKKNVCYVTLNKTFDALTETFKKKSVDVNHIVFIDAISMTIKKAPDQTEGCYFVSSPAALTEISLAVSKFLKHEFDYLIFDSLTNLRIYQKDAPVAQFVSILVNKIKASKTKAVFYALDIDEHQEFIREAGMFVDKVIKV